MIFGLVWLVAGIRLGWRFEWLFLVTLLDLLPFGPALFGTRGWSGCTSIAWSIAIQKRAVRRAEAGLAQPSRGAGLSPCLARH